MKAIVKVSHWKWIGYQESSSIKLLQVVFQGTPKLSKKEVHDIMKGLYDIS
jgi:hypothetical protein